MTKQKEQDWEEIREKLADIEHQRWADWQKYMHSKILPSADDGIMQIGEEFINRWNRQINTPYSELSEAEKKSDMNQVDRYWPLIKTLLTTTEDRVKREIREEYQEIFKWLLGENGDFPDLSQKPHYSFRTELRKRIASLQTHQEEEINN